MVWALDCIRQSPADWLRDTRGNVRLPHPVRILAPASGSIQPRQDSGDCSSLRADNNISYGTVTSRRFAKLVLPTCRWRLRQITSNPYTNNHRQPRDTGAPRPVPALWQG